MFFNDKQLLFIKLILVKLLFHFDISGIDTNEIQLWNISSELAITLVFQTDISGIDITEEQL